MSWQRPKTIRKKALLIYPHHPGRSTTSDAIFPFPVLGLTQIAASLPADYKVRIIDERISPVRGKEEADIVFITVLTVNAVRAYALGDLFKNRGIPVVMGGVHATMLPEEASQHSTSVVIGEAENIIEKLVNDFEKKRMEPIYRDLCPPDLERIPDPHIHLLSWRHRFFLSPIQTTRGCPHNCHFCSVPVAFGRKLRLKSFAKLESELKFLTRFRPRRIFVVDDNFTLNKDHATAIMDLFRHYGFRWMGFSNLAVSDDEEFMRAMKESGCLSLFIGFESLHGQGQLQKNRPYSTPEAIHEAVHRLHEYNIGIQGSFIFGFDQDTIDVFRETVSFIQEAGIELPNINILTPLPGTPLFQSLEKENRLIHKDWSLYDMSHIVFQPKNMSVEELQQGFAWALKYLASPTSILKRLSKRFASMGYFLVANFSLHRHQTRLANSMWNADIQTAMQGRGLCLS